MKAKRNKIFIRFGMVFLLWGLSTASPIYAAVPWHKASVYSSLTFSPREGETYGLEILVLPSSSGKQILWRSGNGRLEPAILLEPIHDNENWVVEVPPVIDGAGKWQLKIKDSEITAIGPKGQTFRLKKIR
jgi:hypothetical protein